MPENLSDRLADKVILHAVDLLRFETHERQKVLRMLRQLESQLIAALYEADPTGITRTAWQQKRLEAMLVQVEKLLQSAYL